MNKDSNRSRRRPRTASYIEASGGWYRSPGVFFGLFRVMNFCHEKIHFINMWLIFLKTDLCASGKSRHTWKYLALSLIWTDFVKSRTLWIFVSNIADHTVKQWSSNVSMLACTQLQCMISVTFQTLKTVPKPEMHSICLSFNMPPKQLMHYSSGKTICCLIIICPEMKETLYQILTDIRIPKLSNSSLLDNCCFFL